MKTKLKVILLSMVSLLKQPIEKIREVNFDFSENKAQSNFGLNENINGLVYKRKALSQHCRQDGVAKHPLIDSLGHEQDTLPRIFG